jgi:hypothetical protein
MTINFLVTTKPEPGLSAAVFAAGVVSPMDVLDEIERELRIKKVEGRVLFDLLLNHGNKVNRYFVADFDGERFQKTRFRSASEDYEGLSKISAKLLQLHFCEMDASLLSNAMRYAITHGIPF